MATRTKATVDDVLRLSAQGERYELIDGELVPMSPTGFEHGGIEGYVAWRFNNHVLPRRLGQVVVGEVLFQLDQAGDLARAPDVAFVSRERTLAQASPARPFVGHPDLAVEIVSPSDSAKDVQKKVDTWLSHGTPAVLVMYPDQHSVVLWRGGTAVSLRGGDELDLDPVLPEFLCKVGDLFPPSLEEDSGADAKG